MPITAFQPTGTTKLIAASSSTAGGEVTQVCTGGQQGMLVTNTSTVTAYLAFGSSTVQAACPTTAAPFAGLALPAGRERPFTTPPAGWLSAVTSAGSAPVFATPGFYGS